MKKLAFIFIIGFVVSFPLAALIGPVNAIIAMSLVTFVISASTTTPRSKTKLQPKTAKLSKDDEELITAILPVINSKR